MPKLGKNDDVVEKKLIFRVLSLQYTVLSALMFRVPFHANLPPIANFLTDDRYINLRP